MWSCKEFFTCFSLTLMTKTNGKHPTEPAEKYIHQGKFHLCKCKVNCSDGFKLDPSTVLKLKFFIYKDYIWSCFFIYTKRLCNAALWVYKYAFIFVNRTKKENSKMTKHQHYFKLICIKCKIMEVIIWIWIFLNQN